jgi:hypothetical protein
MPLLAADIANVEIHEIYHVILNINDIGLLTSLITITDRVRTGYVLANVGKPGVLTSELVEKNLVSLGRLLLNHHFHDEATLGVLFLETTLATYTTKLLALSIDLHIEIVLANRTISEAALGCLRCLKIRRGDLDLCKSGC